jgi:hypothetical protein
MYGSIHCLFTRLLNNQKANYEVSTSKIKKENKQKTKQGNLYNLDNNISSVSAVTPIIIQFNSCLFTCKLNSSDANYKVSTRT